MTASGPAPRSSAVARIGLWSARHRRIVLAGWLAVVAVAIGVCSSVQPDTDVDEETAGGGDTDRATALIEERFPVDEGEVEGTAQEIVFFSHPALRVTDPASRQVVEGLMDELAALRIAERVTIGGAAVTNSTRIVRETTTHDDLGLAREASPFVAANATGGDVTFALVQIDATAVDGVDKVDHILVVTDLGAEVNGRGGFEVLIGGVASLTQQLTAIDNEDLARASLITRPITFAILILAFGAVLAAGVPLALACGSIAMAIAVIAVVSQVFPQSSVFEQMGIGCAMRARGNPRAAHANGGPP